VVQKVGDRVSATGAQTTVKLLFLTQFKKVRCQLTLLIPGIAAPAARSIDCTEDYMQPMTVIDVNNELFRKHLFRNIYVITLADGLL
jgi:hypothetical protein